MKKFELAGSIERIANAGGSGATKFHIPVCDIDILDMVDGEHAIQQQVGLVKIFPNPMGKKFIRKVDGQKIKGQSILVRQFFSRSALNDPRKKAAQSPQGLVERRQGDRRRITLVDSRHWH
nr:hypothetical protein [Methylomarinum sp. Ch1-1]MDP4519513.1 hypothetical protein [Methylomarinum sp. Ch1-1]